ncbi:MAG: winged helix-turn-helix domain-containing protein [Porphyromonas sp.]|nr:winged helix-turn-helix domain-containing protein [Porphyromonas sp.]
MIDQIGTNAGLVWQVLNASKKGLTVKEIKEKSGLSTERDVYYALGWLAKEGKLCFEGEGRSCRISLC